MQRDGRLGGRIVDRRHRRHRLAAIAHLVARQRMLAARDRQHAEGLVAVGAGDDRLHARQLRGLRDVDLEDLGVRIGAAVDAPRQHAGLQDVGRVLGAARHLLRPVHHRHVAADVMRRHHVVHESLVHVLALWRSTPLPACGGGAGVGAWSSWTQASHHPPPQPSPQGGRERTACAERATIEHDHGGAPRACRSAAYCTASMIFT